MAIADIEKGLWIVIKIWGWCVLCAGLLALLILNWGEPVFRTFVDNPLLFVVANVLRMVTLGVINGTILFGAWYAIYRLVGRGRD